MKRQLKRLGAMLIAFVLAFTSAFMGISTKAYAQATADTKEKDVAQEDRTTASAGLSIQGNKLLDGDGKEVILRGVNIPHAWFPKYTQSSIEDVAALGSNAVRVVLSSGDAYTKNTKSELGDIIKWSKETGQICILELHDFTGSGKSEDITESAVSYWREMKDIINENKDYVILNIANEWCGQWETGSLWADTYSEAIPALRNAGIENVIMVDTPGYGNEISVAAKDTNRILQSDPTGNTMFSAHVYGAFGKDASADNVGGTGEAITAGLDKLTATGACYAIGEFGFWQNFNEVDERTLVDYCAKKDIGWMAWSWAGNTGVEHEPLDMTSVKTFSKDDLTIWGKWVFGTKNGIQDTSVLAYSGKTFTGEKITDVPDSVPTPDIKINGPVDNGSSDSAEIEPGDLTKYKWITGHEMVVEPWKELTFEQTDTGVIKIDNLGVIKGVDNTATFQTELQDKGEDWSGHKTIDLIVKNNNTVATMQLAFIMKCGVCLDDEGQPYPGWVQTRTLDPSDNTQFSGQPYVNIPHNKTSHIRFSIDVGSLDPMNPISAEDAIKDVRSFGFRVMQGAAGIVNGDLEILAMGFDWPDDKYAHEIAELNRPKNINRWSWDDVNGTEGTMVSTASGDKVSFAYTMAEKEDGSYAAVNNAQTNPGGKHDVGEDWTAYKSVSATVTNKGTDPVKLTFICKTSSNWTWQENYGKTATKPDTEETVIEPGESLDLTYSLVDPTWKTLKSEWEPTDSLIELNLVKALAWKVYSDTPSSGVIEVSNFSVNFGEGRDESHSNTNTKPTTPSLEPSEEEKPSNTPTVKPSEKPSEEEKPSNTPTVKPSEKPSEEEKPSSTPTVKPSEKPSEEEKPSSTPTVKSSEKPSEEPSKDEKPSSTPTVKPSEKPSEDEKPSSTPTVKPSEKPSEDNKTSVPTGKPSDKPSDTNPSTKPSEDNKPTTPSQKPSDDKKSSTPSDEKTSSTPTVKPSEKPTVKPSDEVTKPTSETKPSDKEEKPSASAKPSDETGSPTPSTKPSEIPAIPSDEASKPVPTVKPSEKPSEKPSGVTTAPTVKPSDEISLPSSKPSQAPSGAPSKEEKPEVVSIRFSAKSITLFQGEKSDMIRIFAKTSEGKEYQVDNREVQFTIADKSIASITADGMVNALKSGETTLTAKVEGQQADCGIYVLPTSTAEPAGPETLTVSQESVDLAAGESIILTAAAGAEIVWTSEDEASVKVTSIDQGKMASIEVSSSAAPGTVNIHVTSGTLKKTIKVNIKGKTENTPPDVDYVKPAETKLTLSKNTLTLNKKKKGSVTATVTSDTMNAKDITIKSSDSKVATAKNSKGTISITAKEAGIAKITVSVGATSKQITVKVKPEKVTKIKKKDATKKSVKLTWKKQSGVNGYELKYNNKVKKISAASYKLTGLKSKKKYVVTIKSYKSTKNGIVYSDKATITVKTK